MVEFFVHTDEEIELDDDASGEFVPILWGELNGMSSLLLLPYKPTSQGPDVSSMVMIVV